MLVKLLITIKNFGCWGIMFLILLIKGFNVGFKDVFELAFSGEGSISYLCIFLVLSIVVYPLLVVVITIIHIRRGISIGDSIAITIPSNFWTPYKGIDFGKDIKRGRNNIVIYDIGIHIKRIIEMIIWWFILITFVKDFFLTKNTLGLEAFSKTDIMTRMILFAVFIVAVNFIIWLIMKAVSRKWKSSSRKGSYSTRSNHTGRIPVGCSACGGPYPDCRSSCNLIDE